MPEWRIEIPEQTLYWDSEQEPDIRLVIDGIDDHRYLLDYRSFNDNEDENVSGYYTFQASVMIRADSVEEAREKAEEIAGHIDFIASDFHVHDNYPEFFPTMQEKQA